MPKKQGEKKDTALPATDMSLNGLGDRLIYLSNIEKCLGAYHGHMCVSNPPLPTPMCA